MRLKTLTIFGALTAVACIAARTIALLYATESATGFFISRLIPLGIALCAAVFILTAIATAFSFTVKEKAKNKFSLSKMGGVFSIILGVAVLGYCFGFGTHAYTVLWQHILETVSGIVCAVWFIVYGLSAFMDLKLPEIFAVAPCVHWIFRLVVVFSTFSTTALVAEHVFSLGALCATTVFMLQFGKAVSGTASEKTLVSLYPTAICSAVLSLTSSVSRLIVTLMGAVDKIHGEVPLDIVGIFVGIFMLVITADIIKESKITETEEKPNEI